MTPDDRVHVYATALYETAWDRWLAAMTRIAEQLQQNPTLGQRLEAPATELGQRQRIIDGLLPSDVDLPIRNFLYTLAQRNDLDLLPEVIEELRQRMRRAGAKPPIEVEVTSALPLSEDERQALQNGLQQYGEDLDIRYRVEASILGGLIIRVGDRLIDNSLATRLSAMRQALGVTSAG